MTASPHRNRNRILAGFGATAMVAGLTLLIFFDPSSESFFPACPLYTTTGLACAGCGLTRATHAIIHGDLYRGIRYNILSPLVMVLLGYTWLALAGFPIAAWKDEHGDSCDTHRLLDCEKPSLLPIHTPLSAAMKKPPKGEALSWMSFEAI